MSLFPFTLMKPDMACAMKSNAGRLLGAGFPKAVYGGINQPGINFPEIFISQAHLVSHTGPEVFNQHVGVFHQAADYIFCLIRAEISGLCFACSG